MLHPRYRVLSLACMTAAACSSGSSSPAGDAAPVTRDSGAANDAAVGNQDAATAGDTASADAPVPGAVDGGASGAGTYVYVSGYAPIITVEKLDLTTGALAPSAIGVAGMAPSWMTFAPSKKFAYALDEVDDDGIIAFSVDGANGVLKELGRVLAGGKGAAHLAVHPSGKWLATAHYDSNSITVHELKPDGTVGAKTDEKVDCMAAHETVFASAGAIAFTNCLMSNYVGQWKFADGKLTPAATARVDVAGGPRHLVLDQGEKHAYVISESINVINTFDVVDGQLTKPRTLSSLDMGGTTGAAGEILLHPTGKYLYASNRMDNSIGIFSVDGTTGDLRAIAWQKSGAAWVRGMAIDPSGTYLLAANQMLDKVVVFKIDAATGKLTATGTPLSVPAGPALVSILTLP
jgi:6-phosphogluconolactonase